VSGEHEEVVTESSGNVFADLGHANPEEALAKAKLAHAIAAIIADRGLTQAEAAGMLGIDQPKISALTRGHLSGFSMERLLRFLIALDRDVEILVKPKSNTSSHARLEVTAA
jgi:predicted XRE-type DNA-binding protein